LLSSVGVFAASKPTDLSGKPARLTFRPPLAEGWVSASWSSGSSLQVSVSVPLATVSRVTLHFAGAGVASEGASFPPKTEVTGAVWKEAELTVSPEGLPPFPVKGPLIAELCLAMDSGSNSALHCAEVRFPASLKQGAPKVPSQVVALQRRGKNWLGSTEQGDARWVWSPTPLNPESLSPVVAKHVLSAQALGFHVPEDLRTPTGERLVAILDGQDPFSPKGCDSTQDVRLTLWAIRKQVALKVLGWPVLSCDLGRGTAVSMDSDGALSIGYSGGLVIRFTWVTDHFERTELGWLERRPSKRAL
jgi:hypothetical protein